jgi:hypothetical protein
MRTDKAVQEEMMATKSPQAQPKGNVKLEDRYGAVAIRAVAGALHKPKSAKAGQ